MDELARALGIDPFELRRRNVVVPGDRMLVVDPDEDERPRHARQLRPRPVPRPRRGGPRPTLRTCPRRAGWRRRPGHGDRHDRDDAAARALRRDAVTRSSPTAATSCGVGTAEFGNGTTTVHAQLAADGARHDRRPDRIRQSDTDVAGYDTGAFGSAGVVVAGKALHRPRQAATQLIWRLCAARPRARTAMDAGGARVGERCAAGRASRAPHRPTAGHHDGTPRSVAFNVHGFRVAVNPGTGEVRILQSVQAADAGTVLNPEQLRGQIEGGTGAGHRHRALRGDAMDGEGRVTTAAFRNYHVPQFADLPAHRGAVRRRPTTSSGRSAPSR